jgi:hypothetical protein
LSGAEKLARWKVDQKYLESFKIWICRRVENIGWTDCVRNEEVLRSQGRQECPTYIKKKEY